jgi:hypothetical protein
MPTRRLNSLPITPTASASVIAPNPAMGPTTAQPSTT